MSYQIHIKEVSGNKVGELLLFALSTCVWCKKTKGLLNDLGVEYRYVDVDLLEGESRSDAMRDIEHCNASLSFPTLRVNNEKCIVGFSEDEIKELLKNGG